MFREKNLSLLLGQVVLPRNLICFTESRNVCVFLINIVEAVIELTILFLNLILFSLHLDHFHDLHLFLFVFQKAYRETLLIQRQVFAIRKGRYSMGSSLTYHVSWSLVAITDRCSSLLSFALQTKLLHIIIISNAVLSPLVPQFTCTFDPLESIGVVG